MDKYGSIVFLLASVFSIVVSEEIARKGYYWRPYDGIMLADAFVAGYDNDDPIYIGKAFIEGKVFPGKIYEGDANLYFEWEQQPWATNTNVKILCSQQPDRFVWRATSNAQLFPSDRRFLVKGGRQLGFKTYIGRVQMNGETIVGKVMCNYSYCLALYAVKNGNQVEYHSYEVLQFISVSVKRLATNELLLSET